MKIRRHDADDMVRVIVQPQGLAENMWVGAEVPLPESVADDHFQVEARCWIVGIEHAAQLGFDIEQRKVIRRNRLKLDANWLRRARDINRPASLRRNVLENSRTLEVLPLRHGQVNVACADAGKIILDADKLFGLGVRQRMQKHGIDDAVNRSRGSHTQSDCENHNGRETGRSRKLAKRVAQILQ